MKKIMMIAATALALAACENAATDGSSLEEKVPTKQFTFHVKGDFELSYTEMSRATRLENGNTSGLTDLWVMDYMDGALVQKVHQSSTAADFGTVPLTLAYGQHNILFVASKGTTPTLSGDAVGSTAATLAWTKVMDTFTLAYPLEVTSSSNGNRAPELQRAIGGVTVHMKDAVPANAATVDVLWDHSKTLTLPSLSPATPQSGTTTLAFPADYIGHADMEFKVYTLVPDLGITTAVQLTFKDGSGNTISTRTIPNVEIRKNRITKLSGKCFTASDASVSFGVNVADTWLTSNEIAF